mgnify:FL=1
MKNYRKTSDGKKGGLFVGKSHAKGGIPAIVVDTGQPIEVEGGEAIINKEATKKYWKELSKINQSAGDGNPIPPPQGFSDDVNQFNKGGKISKMALLEGTKHELEHTDTIEKFKKQGVSDKEIAKQIALDHLKENPNYYKILRKIKLAKGGELVCRSCSNSWNKAHKKAGMNVYECDKCGSENSKYYRTGGAVENKKEVYDEWKSLVNMSSSELESFLKTEDGKKAGLSKSEASELGIGSGHESASWILKMKEVPYSQWSDTMWSWAKRQISFVKRMKGNKGDLYDDKGNKTRKHTSLLIWGHNPEKFDNGGTTESTQYPFVIVIKNIKNPTITTKGILNMYRGVYQKIFEILDEDSIFMNWEYEYDKLVNNDLYLFFDKTPDYNKIEKIKTLANVEVLESFDKGGRTIAQTPAPKKDRIVGSKLNPPKSSESSKSAEKIVLSEQTLESIETILREHNKTSDKKVDLNTAKAVVRRGMGAYSSSHRPTISGGKPNSRVAWGLARLKAFLYKVENEKSKSGKYSQDNDLLDDLGFEHEKYAKGNKIPSENKGGNCYEVAGKIAMGRMFANKEFGYPDFIGTPYLVHAEVSGQGAISGLRYGHAWVEDDMFIYDYSNGRKIVFPKELYYAIGNVITKKPKYFKYTFDEARKKMVETGHYGSWELKTESGL